MYSPNPGTGSWIEAGFPPPYLGISSEIGGIPLEYLVSVPELGKTPNPGVNTWSISELGSRYGNANEISCSTLWLSPICCFDNMPMSKQLLKMGDDKMKIKYNYLIRDIKIN